MSEAREEAPWVELDGDRYEIPQLEDLSLGEMATVKRISGLVGLHEQTRAMAVFDPDMWSAMALVAVQREKPEVTLERVQSVKLLHQFAEQEKADQENAGQAADDSPPDVPSAEQPAPPPAEEVEAAADGATGSEPKTSGSPLSEPSSD